MSFSLNHVQNIPTFIHDPSYICSDVVDDVDLVQ